MKSPAPSLLQAPKDYSSTPKQNETGISHSLRHWTELSTHLEATISQAMLRLRSSLSTESEDPLISQLCGQISSLSITCGSLSKALDQLQKEHDGIKSDYGKFLQSNVRNQEKLVEIVEKREAQVLELRNQHSIDVKKLIARIADTHTELEQMRTELESTKSARDQLSKEVDDLKLDLQAALEEAIQLTNDIKEQEAKAKNTSKEVAELRDHLRDRDNDEEALRQQIANEKAQRLIAIQHLTETFAESSSLAGDSSMLRKVSTNS
jgi:chromosome segregation ATPase